MVDLFNITFDGKTISCDYAPEDSNKKGSVVVDVDTREILSVNYSAYEYGREMYAAHVRSKLLGLIDSGQPVPKNAKAIWY